VAKPGLRTLAEHLGLTESTVSRALNNYPDISEKTRSRVKAAADDLGYRPNQNARRLATGDSECIGFLPPSSSNYPSDPFLAVLLGGLSRSVSSKGWDLLINTCTSIDEEIAQLKKWAATRRVDGVVLSRTLADDPRVETLLELDMPFITHGRTRNSDAHAWLDTDNFAAFELGFDYLHNHGHRAIAYIGGPRQYNFSNQRLAGYLSAAKGHSLNIKPEWVVESDISVTAGSAAMNQLLQLPDTPTAVLCVTDMVALGAMNALRANDLIPGRDVSIVGYDGLEVGACTTPTLTSMTQPLADAGSMLGDMLFDVIQGEPAAKLQRLVNVQLVERGSVSAQPTVPTGATATNQHNTESTHSQYLPDSHAPASAAKKTRRGKTTAEELS